MCRSPLSCRSVTTVGELTRERRLHLAPVLTEGRLDVRHARAGRTPPPRFRDEQVARLRVEQAVLAQLESLANRDLPDPDVVRLRAGEVDHRGSPRLLRDRPAGPPAARLGQRSTSSSRPCAITRRRTDARRSLHHRAGRRLRPRAGRRPRSSPASAGASRRRPTRRASGSDDRTLEERLRDIEGDVDLDPPAGGSHLLDAAGDVLLRLRAEPLQRGHPVLLDRGHQLVHGIDAELLIERPSPSWGRARGWTSCRGRRVGSAPELLELRDGARSSGTRRSSRRSSVPTTGIFRISGRSLPSSSTG